MKSVLFTFLLIISCITFHAQETIVKPKTLENQFDDIYRTSTSYQIYKVIGKDRFQNLKKQVNDTVNNYKKLLSAKEILLKTETQKFNATKEQEGKTKLALEAALKKENSISLFGWNLSKTNYNILLWSIISLLLIGLFYFMYKFKNSHVLTKDAKNSLIDVEQEFEKHRKKALEKEQKLRRQLQDEINKQRNS